MRHYEERLTFKDVLSQVDRDISNGKYGRWWPNLIREKAVSDLLSEKEYLGRQASREWLEEFEDIMDLWAIHAFYSEPKFFHSSDPEIKLLVQHLERRRTEMSDRKPKVRQNAARFLERLLNKRDGQRRCELPTHLYISGLVHFLLPIAHDLHDKYIREFPSHKTKINRGDNPTEIKNWKAKVKALDPQIAGLDTTENQAEISQLSKLISNGPKSYIENILLPDHFGISKASIHNRLYVVEKTPPS